MIKKMHDEIIRAKTAFTTIIEDFDSFRLIPIMKLLTAQRMNRTQMIESGTVACLKEFRVLTISIMLLSAGIIWFDEMRFAGSCPSRAACSHILIEIELDRFRFFSTSSSSNPVSWLAILAST
jgi:hypothetical protein